MQKQSLVSAAILTAVVIASGYLIWTIAPSEKVVYKEQPKQITCEEQNKKFSIDSRVAVLEGYYSGIEGTVVGHTDDEFCKQVVRIEHKGKWYTPTVKSNNLAKVGNE